MKFSTQFGVTHDSAKGVVFYAIFHLKSEHTNEFQQHLHALCQNIPSLYSPCTTTNGSEFECRVDGVVAFSQALLSHTTDPQKIATIAKSIAGALIMGGQNHLVKPLYDAHNMTPPHVQNSAATQPISL